ncbi:MAG: TIGR02710 family CRISPR-associated protein [Ignavibacteriales bacterium]|nr:TIGR02710 family CRISPR-associated protein [Ignavibacteriales bacterium]
MNENSSKKLYIATVGTGTSGEDIAHALYFSINDKNPDTAVFILSKKTKDETYPFIEERLKTDKPNLIYYPKLVEEVNEFEVLHKAYLSLIKEYVKQGYKTKNIVLDYTSGTKSMSAALVSAGIAAEVGLISYTYGTRGEGGRVKSGSERITSLSTNLFNTERKISQAITLFNKYLFDAAEEILASFDDIPHPDYEYRIKFIASLSQALSNWDKFNFNSASEELKSISEDENLVNEAKSFGVGINKLIQATNFLKEKKLNFYKVIELISNAKRRAKEGKYDDSIARLYRAIEMIGQIEFEREFKCDTSDVLIQNIPTEFIEEIKTKYYDAKDGKVKLPLFATFDLLNKVKNNIGNRFFNNFEKIKKVLHLRNNSILAHGIRPLNEKEFNEALLLVEDLLKETETIIDIPNLPVLR